MNSLDKLKLNLITQAKDKRENKSENNSEAIAMSEKITEVVSNETFESEVWFIECFFYYYLSKLYLKLTIFLRVIVVIKNSKLLQTKINCLLPQET